MLGADRALTMDSYSSQGTPCYIFHFTHCSVLIYGKLSRFICNTFSYYFLVQVCASNREKLTHLQYKMSSVSRGRKVVLSKRLKNLRNVGTREEAVEEEEDLRKRSPMLSPAESEVQDEEIGLKDMLKMMLLSQQADKVRVEERDRKERENG